MHREARQFFEFGPFRLDPSERTLRRGDQPVPLPPKLFDTLSALVERSGHLVGKDEMLKIVWADAFVEEGSLTRAVSRLRQVLGSNDGDATYIETIPKVGYRFVASVRIVREIEENLILEEQVSTRLSIEETAAPDALVRTPGAGVELSAAAAAHVSNAAASPRRIPKAAILAAAGILLVVLAALAFRQDRMPVRAPAAASAHSLAILPLRAAGASPTEEKIGVEVAGELSSRFGRLTRIALRQSSAAGGDSHPNPDPDPDPVRAGQRLGADWILAGTVREQPGHDLYSVRLVDTRDGRARWAKEFESGPGDALSAANTISIGLAEALAPELSARDREAIEEPRSDHLDAYQLVMKGRLVMNRGGKGLLEAGDYFELAIQKDPRYALAYASLADCYSSMYDSLVISFSEGAPDARRNALKALELDGVSADAHLSLAVVRYRFDWDWLAADREYRRALELRPDDAGILTSRGYFENEMGRFDDALRELRRARELNPDSPWISTLMGETLRRAGQSDPAIAELQRAISMDPALGAAHYKLGMVYEQRGMHEAAIAEFLRCLDLYGVKDTAAAVRKANEAGGPMSAYRAWLERCQIDPEIKAVRIAEIYEVLGQSDRALDALEMGFAKRSAGICAIGAEPTLSGLRSNPRFQALLHKMNVPARAL